MENNYVIFTFHSTHLALEFEGLLKNIGLEVKIIPVPRKISSSCGLAGRIMAEDFEKTKLACENNNIEFEAVYSYSESRKEFKKLISWEKSNKQ